MRPIHFGTYYGHEEIDIRHMNDAGRVLWQVESYDTGKVIGTAYARTGEGAERFVAGKLTPEQAEEAGRLMACFARQPCA